MKLPKGIWYEAGKRRWRVRRYKNRVSYLKGYYTSLDEAIMALKELNEYLDTIPQEPRRRPPKEPPTVKVKVSDTVESIREKQARDPGLLKRQRREQD